MEVSTEDDLGIRCTTQLSITMDYDSGYMSRNAESNLDSCPDFNTNEGTLTRKTFYLSEDALLEKPEVTVHKIEDCNPNSDNSEVISASEGSQEMDYSTLFDSEPGTSSDNSLTIPVAKPIAFNSALSNITNTINANCPQKRLTLIFSKLDKENAYSVKRKYSSFSSEESGNSRFDLDSSSTFEMSSTFCESETSFLENEITDKVEPNVVLSSATPMKRIVNTRNPDLSPDLFIEEEPPALRQSPILMAKERYVTKNDQQFLNKVNNSLKGVLPPHSMTVVKFSIEEMLDKIESNKELFWDRPTSMNKEHKTLLLSGQVEDKNRTFPEILKGRWHGLHYNRSKLSEQIEELCIRYGERYVGAETQSSCTSLETDNPSPPKQRPLKRFGLKSPGRRLSHLAKRRITFSSANLQASSSFAGSRARQILVDARKLDILKRKSPRKTPKKTPSKSPRIKTRTPSSSAKKKLAVRFRKLAGEIEKTVDNPTSKRKLFRSPTRESKSNLFLSSSTGKSNFDEETKRPTKRALFMSPNKSSPHKYSPFKKSPHRRLLNVQKKRKRNESDSNPPLLTAQTDTSGDEIKLESESKFLTRAKSEVGEMSATHKKKLQWAVYEALSSQNVKPTHPHFKLFASILARVTKRLLPYYTTVIGKDVGTSERMLRITKCHVFAVTKGKSVEEIVSEYLRNRTRNAKPQGYIAIDTLNGSKNETEDSRRFGRNTDRIKKVINFGDDR